VTDDSKSTSLFQYEIYYVHKKFYETGPRAFNIKLLCNRN